jgi:hypothetical protein
MEPRVGQLQPECILPIDPAAHSISGLAVGQVLKKLEDRDQRQSPRRKPRLAPGGIKLLEILILIQGAERLA